ncbi:MAG TPA: NTF2 fold immunity protein [Verrucomicrobiae bacterium]|jgi:hypothetical protein|nr:NTF2 fold immunity protein [Verrucomicrobiae bacterium]
MKTILAAALFAGFVQGAQHSQTPSSIRVPDAATAVAIAEPALVKVYGKRQIDYEKPLIAALENGIWNIHGSLCCPGNKGERTCDERCAGGVAELKLPERDGKVLSISHSK